MDIEVYFGEIISLEYFPFVLEICYDWFFTILHLYFDIFIILSDGIVAVFLSVTLCVLSFIFAWQNLQKEKLMNKII